MKEILLAMCAILLSAPALALPPAELYVLNCWGCHQPDARGIPGAVPRLSHSMGYFLYLSQGRAYLAQVPGVANSPLNDEQTAEVLNWLLGTFNKNELPRDFAPYTAEEAGKLRKQRLADVKATRASLQKQLAVMGYTIAPAQ